VCEDDGQIIVLSQRLKEKSRLLHDPRYRDSQRHELDDRNWKLVQKWRRDRAEQERLAGLSTFERYEAQRMDPEELEREKAARLKAMQDAIAAKHAASSEREKVQMEDYMEGKRRRQAEREERLRQKELEKQRKIDDKRAKLQRALDKKMEKQRKEQERLQALAEEKRRAQEEELERQRIAREQAEAAERARLARLARIQAEAARVENLQKEENQRKEREEEEIQRKEREAKEEKAIYVEKLKDKSTATRELANKALRMMNAPKPSGPTFKELVEKARKMRELNESFNS